MKLTDLTLIQLNRAVELRKAIDSLTTELDYFADDKAANELLFPKRRGPGRPPGSGKKKRHISSAGRAAIAAAARRRWRRERRVR